MRAEPSVLRDFTVDKRVWLLSSVSVGIGALATLLAVLLLRAIALSTNLFYYHRFSIKAATPAGSPLGYWMVLVPILGGLIVGLMARYGSDKIRGHGIPEAIEAILLHRAQSRSENRDIETRLGGDCDWLGWTFRSGRPHHYDRRSGRIADRAMADIDGRGENDAFGGGSGSGYVRDFRYSSCCHIDRRVELSALRMAAEKPVPVAFASATAGLLRVYLVGRGAAVSDACFRPIRSIVSYCHWRSAAGRDYRALSPPQ